MLILLHDDIKTFLIIRRNILSATMKLNLMVRIRNGMTLITIFQVIFFSLQVPCLIITWKIMVLHSFLFCAFLVHISPSICSEISSRLFAASRFLFCLQSVIFSKPFLFFSYAVFRTLILRVHRPDSNVTPECWTNKPAIQ